MRIESEILEPKEKPAPKVSQANLVILGHLEKMVPRESLVWKVRLENLEKKVLLEPQALLVLPVTKDQKERKDL